MAISGRNGQVIINDGTDKVVSACTEWSLDIKTDTEEITAFGSSGWKESMYMMSSWSGSASCKWDVNNATSTGQSGIQTKMLTPASVSIKLYIDADTYYSGTAFLSSWNIKTPANGIVEAELQFEGSGALTYTPGT